MPGFDRTTLGMMAMFTLGATACSAERAALSSGAGTASSSAIVTGTKPKP